MGSPPSAAHTTPWPRPRRSRGLWPEARSSEGAAPRSRPCRTGTAAPELKHSDDRPHAPWFASATHGPSVYPQSQPSGIPADPFSRSPYELPLDLRSGGVAPLPPTFDLTLQGVLMGDATRQALARQDAQLDLSLVQPGAVLRCVMDLKAVG